MKTAQYIWSGYWGMVFFGIRDIYRRGILPWMGIACYALSILDLVNTFTLSSGAFNLPDKVRHQLLPVMVVFALFCLYLGGYFIHKSKRDADTN